MHKPLIKFLLMISVLFSYVGQTMAYHVIAMGDGTLEQSALSKSTNNKQQANNQPQENIKQQTNAKQQTNIALLTQDTHSENQSESVDDCCDVECCESECICPSNTCAANAYLLSSLPLSDFVLLSESLLLLKGQASHFIASSLYRPPIFTS